MSFLLIRSHRLRVSNSVVDQTAERLGRRQRGVVMTKRMTWRGGTRLFHIYHACLFLSFQRQDRRTLRCIDWPCVYRELTLELHRPAGLLPHHRAVRCTRILHLLITTNCWISTVPLRVVFSTTVRCRAWHSTNQKCKTCLCIVQIFLVSHRCSRCFKGSGL